MTKKRPLNRREKIVAALNRTILRPGFLKWYGIIAVIVLLLTTTFWSLLAAIVHLQNADQLIDPTLFENTTTFHQATFPGQHTFLFKWPLFLLVHLAGSSAHAFAVMTVVACLVTIILLAYLLYRIDRRPLVFGTLFLALASTLLLVPAEAYPGALLPVNMAMLATRNLEYILYIGSLLLLVRARRLVSWSSVLTIISLGILIASDKLFLSLSLGGALVALTTYLLFRRRPFIILAFRWFLVTIIAAGFAFAALWILTATHITTIDNGSGVSPYALTHTFKDLALGISYGILGLFTNFGANPVADIVVLKDVPVQLLHRFMLPGTISYLINIALAVIGLVMSYKLCRTSLSPTLVVKHRAKKSSALPAIDIPLHLSLTLIWTTLASLILFVASTHYYAVDARYVSIVVFTVFIAGATYLRSVKKLNTLLVTTVGGVVLVGLSFGLLTTIQVHNRSMTAQSDIISRDKLVISALNQHNVDTFIGDYWRVNPIKLGLNHPQTIMPLSDCATPRTILTSKLWQQDSTKHSFAYLLPLEPSITGFPACSIDQVVMQYGRPNSSQVIAGTTSDPREVLLFYDYGANPDTKHATGVATSILPRPISQLYGTRCNSSTTIMNIVAHQDDDLLFMNPDLLHSIKNGACVRSIYLTAGDSGSTSLYWLGREEGSKAAYAKMLGIANPVWNTRTITLSDSEYITVSRLKDSTQVSLIFFHLPDGNLNGQGFPATKRESLMKLETGAISHIDTVDGQSKYSSDELTNGLVDLMETFGPTEVHTQATHNLSNKFADHSDHLIAGLYAKKAYDIYTQQHHDGIPIEFYIGYPIRERPENVSGQDLKDTEAVFFTYAKYDKGTCESVEACSKMSYIYYLNRQYHTSQ